MGKTENSIAIGPSAGCNANKLRNTEKYSGNACCLIFLLARGVLPEKTYTSLNEVVSALENAI